MLRNRDDKHDKDEHRGMKWRDADEIFHSFFKKNEVDIRGKFLSGSITEQEAITAGKDQARELFRQLKESGYISSIPNSRDIDKLLTRILDFRTFVGDMSQCIAIRSDLYRQAVTTHNTDYNDDEVFTIPETVQRGRKIRDQFRETERILGKSGVEDNQKRILSYIDDLKNLGFKSIQDFDEQDRFYVERGL